MSKTFRCKRSGNLLTLHLENDILSMKGHEGYEEVNDEKEVQRKETPKEVLKLKKREQQVPAFLQE